jgi:hypothetical protein
LLLNELHLPFAHAWGGDAEDAVLLLSAYRHAGRAAFSIPIGVASRVLKAALRRGYSVIIPPIFWLVWRIPIGSRNVSDE